MGKHFEVDSERLIDAIKKNEQLWNKHDKEYHRKNMKEAAWMNVCQEICSDWDDLDENEKNSKLTKVKKRWNNIRDYYKKDLALQLNGSIGQHAMKQKKYMFSNKLEFLRPIFEKSLLNSTANNEFTSDNEQEEYMVVNYSSDSENSTPFKPKIRSSIKTELQTDSTDDESDLMFLKSLAPDMKVLNRRQKIEFKLGILQLYKNLTMPQSGIDPLDDDDDIVDKKFAV